MPKVSVRVRGVMLIVSKFHDYYDSAIGYGVDKTIVYKRVFDDSGYKYNSFFKHEITQEPWGKKECSVGKFTIGFCGKLYPGVYVEIWHNYSSYEERIFYSAQELGEYMASLGVVASRKRPLWGIDLRYQPHREEYFRVVENDELFFKHKCPVLYKSKGGIKLNPCLKDYNFQTVKDPFTAFQDILMYISGVLGVDQRPMVEISDEDKAHKKGHGGKYSFRMPPKGK